MQCSNVNDVDDNDVLSDSVNDLANDEETDGVGVELSLDAEVDDGVAILADVDVEVIS